MERAANMEACDYTHVFDDLSDTLRAVTLFGRSTAANMVSTYKVVIDDRQLLSLRRVPEEVADLMDLAVAVYIADRLSIRKASRSRRTQIHVVVPVRHPEILGSAHVCGQLGALLHWFTGDHWSFDFTYRTRGGRTAELQMTMPLADDGGEPSEVALWSGGLDSLAGLCCRLSAAPSRRYTLLGTGSNTILQSTQRQVAVRLRGKFPGRIRLIQIPIRLGESIAVRKESRQRSRGFVFMLLA
jgi:hypothetical protein